MCAKSTTIDLYVRKYMAGERVTAVENRVAIVDERNVTVSFRQASLPLLVLGVVVVGLCGVAEGRQLGPQQAGQDHTVVQVVTSWEAGKKKG